MKRIRFHWYLLFFGLSLLSLTTCKNPALSDLVAMIDEEVSASKINPSISLYFEGSEILPKSISDIFDDAIQGVPEVVEFTIQNTGTGNLIFRDTDPILISGPHKDLFSVSANLSSLTLAPEEEATFSLQLILNAIQSLNAQLEIYSNDLINNPYTVNLTNITLSSLMVSVGGTDYPNNSVDVSYGSSTYSTGTYTDITVTLKNTGESNINLDSTDPVEITGFSSEIIQLPETPLLPLGSTNLVFRVSPNGPGLCTGTVKINSDTPGTETFLISLMGSFELPLRESYITLGYENSSSRDENGDLFSWGNNDYGQLGDGTTVDACIPSRVDTQDFCFLGNGSYHSLAIDSSGSVWTWGDNGSGRLGDGTQTDRYSPVKLNSIDDVVKVAGGRAFSLALKNDGTVWAWGDNDYGQIGDGSTPPRYTPKQITSLEGIIDIDAGGYHSMALQSDGTVWTWGANSKGQLGINSIAAQISPVTVSTATGIADIIKIHAGYETSFAIDSNGDVWSWGNNFYGQIGNGARPDDQLTPFKILDLPNIDRITAGTYTTLTLNETGNVYVWGYNAAGGHGDGTSGNSDYALLPQVVPGLSDIDEIDNNGFHSIALKNDGRVFTWGRNSSGQIGNGEFSDDSVTTPTAVAGMEPVVGAAASGDGGDLIWMPRSGHSLFIMENGTVQSCGMNDYGQLGNGDTIDHSLPVDVIGLDDIVEVSTGIYFSSALKSDGTVWSWGENIKGQLGDGHRSFSDTPTPTPVQATDLPTIVKLDSGWQHTIAIDSTGTIWVWGSNTYGEHGVGHTNDYFYPVVPKHNPDVGSADVIDVSAGAKFSLSLQDGGVVKAWGLNTYGQLGDGSTSDKTLPVTISGMSNVGAISAGWMHSLALNSITGQVYAWGRNNHGQLGDNSTTNQSSPITVSVLTDITAISAGGLHSLALKSDGTVYAWGENENSQLGDGTTSDHHVPTLVPGLDSVIAIAAGDYHSFAWKADGTVWVWGEGAYNRLGVGDTIDRSSPTLVGGALTLW